MKYLPEIMFIVLAVVFLIGWATALVRVVNNKTRAEIQKDLDDRLEGRK